MIYDHRVNRTQYILSNLFQFHTLFGIWLELTHKEVGVPDKCNVQGKQLLSGTYSFTGIIQFLLSNLLTRVSNLFIYIHV